MSDGFDRRPIALTTAFAAVLASSALRAPWFLLLLIMPSSTWGVLLFCLVLVSAGVLLLQWCLGWFGWTIPIRGALAARALPAIVAVSTTGALGLRRSVPVLVAMVVLELVLATAVVAVMARSLDDGFGITGFEEGELLPLRDYYYEDDEEVAPGEDRYGRDVASLVREARESRLRAWG